MRGITPVYATRAAPAAGGFGLNFSYVPAHPLSPLGASRARLGNIGDYNCHLDCKPLYAEPWVDVIQGFRIMRDARELVRTRNASPLQR